MSSVSVKLDLKPMERMISRYEKAERGGAKIRGRGAANPIEAMYRQWAFRYMAFARRRFVKFSRGGGNWAPLKASTLRQRRGGTASILRDTSILFNGMSIGQRGNETKRIKNGVQYGFGGPARHPDGKLTIRRLAEIHQNGSRKRNIPARPIIVLPDQKTRTGMMSDLARATQRSAK